MATGQEQVIDSWLAAVPLGTPISCPPSIEQQIVTQTAKAPFCFKDPRFCYTLPAWRPHARHAVFLCIFREPARTVQSILKECRDAPVPLLWEISLDV